MTSRYHLATERLLENQEEELGGGLLPMTVYNDEEAFQAELHRIFG